MTLEQLHARFPNVRDAVTLHEGPKLRQLWNSARKSASCPTPQDVVDALKRTAARAARAVPVGPLSEGQPARVQMDHPQFLEYVTWKLSVNE